MLGGTQSKYFKAYHFKIIGKKDDIVITKIAKMLYLFLECCVPFSVEVSVLLTFSYGYIPGLVFWLGNQLPHNKMCSCWFLSLLFSRRALSQEILIILILLSCKCWVCWIFKDANKVCIFSVGYAPRRFNSKVAFSDHPACSWSPPAAIYWCCIESTPTAVLHWALGLSCLGEAETNSQSPPLP